MVTESGKYLCLNSCIKEHSYYTKLIKGEIYNLKLNNNYYDVYDKNDNHVFSFRTESIFNVTFSDDILISIKKQRKLKIQKVMNKIKYDRNN